MQRIKDGVFVLVFAVIILGLFLAQGVNKGELVANNSIPVYMMRGNIFSECFKEPVEVIIFVANNGNFYRFTNFDSQSVTMTIDEFEYILEKDGLTIKDLTFVIHNHIEPPFKFTLPDKRFYSLLWHKGFRGLFLLWSSFHQKVVDCLPAK